MHPISISPIPLGGLTSFFTNFNFTQDSQNLQNYIDLVQETSHCYQSIIHEAYSLIEEESFGFISLRTTYDDIDGVPGVLVEFLYLKEKYRSNTEEFSQIKYSFLLLDYIIEVAIKVQRQVAINHVYLVPINDKVRDVYKAYGFENIPNSGQNEYEDYMVFNLLEEDPTLLEW